MDTDIYQSIEAHVEGYFFERFPDLPTIEEMMEEFMAWDEEFWLVYKNDMPSFKQDFYQVFRDVYHDKKALCN